MKFIKSFAAAVMFSFFFFVHSFAQNDLAVVDFFPHVTRVKTPAVPVVVIKNTGSAEYTGQVVLNVKYNLQLNEVYNETLSLDFSSNAFPAGAMLFISMPAFKDDGVGLYNGIAEITVDNDDNPDNDGLESGLLVTDIAYNPGTMYCYAEGGDYDSHMVSVDMNDYSLPVTDLHNLGDTVLTAGDYTGDVIKAVTGDNKLFYVLPDGNLAYFGPITGVTGIITGFAKGPYHYWAVSFDKATEQSYIYAIDTATLVATQQISYDNTFLCGMAADGQKIITSNIISSAGVYSNGNFYLIENGELTSPAQIKRIWSEFYDFAYDNIAQTYFGAVTEMNDGGTAFAANKIVKLDPSTGDVTDYCSAQIPFQSRFAAVIPGVVEPEPTAVDYSSSDIKVYPNPVTDKLIVTNARNTRLTLSDLSGKVLISRFAKTDNYVLDVSAISPGIYILKLDNDKLTASKKIVVK